MPREWTSGQLRFLTDARELEISAPRSGDEPGRWVPIWVVVEGGRVFVRTWYRRSTGWYGHAVASERAWIRVLDAPMPVSVTAVGSVNADAVDRAYRRKYGDSAASSMVTAEAGASTLRLTPA